MIWTLLIFLPFFACLFSLLVHLKLAARARAFKPYIWFVALLGVFIFTDCCYADPRVPEVVLTRSTLVSLIAAPSIIPLLIMLYRRTRLIEHTDHPMEMLWVLVPAILFSAAIALYIIIGEQEIVRHTREFYNTSMEDLRPRLKDSLGMYYFVTVVLFRIALTVETLWFAVYVIRLAIKERFSLKNLFGFYFRGKEAKTIGLITLFVLPAYFIVIIKFALLKQVMYNNPLLAVAFAVLLTFCIVGFSYIMLFSSRVKLNRREMRNGWRYNYSDAHKGQIVEEMLDSLLDDAEEDALRRIQERLGEALPIEEFRSETPFPERAPIADQIFSAVSSAWGEDRMLANFQKLMRDEQLFLQPRLSLDDVALKLGTNKVYVSRLVNNAYNLGFPELINILRVDYAEQYILNHGEARQDEIAHACGFLSASSFNTTFKKVTGMTPKVWIASQQKH